MPAQVKLDKQQTEAVTTQAKNVIVAAGAGSGKTRVIIERIRHLVEHGEQPSSIVAITFTNMAAQEIKMRLADVPNSGDIFVGTIHSFANQILFNSGKQYEIFSEQKQNEIMQWLCSRFARHLTHDRYLQYMEVQKQVDLGYSDVSVIKDTFNTAERYELGMFLSKGKPHAEAGYPANVRSVAKVRGYITFDELLELSGQYFESIGANGVEHLLVDEFQDIGYLEYKFLKTLSAAHNFYVGDDWQAIYGWKGGNVNIFKRLVLDKDWQRIDLVNNYRSSPAVIDAGIKVISYCDDIIDKEVFHKGQYTHGKFDRQSKFKLESILSKVAAECMGDGGKDLRDWFILVRKNIDLTECAERLDKLGIPFTTFRKSEISYNELQDLMAENTVKLLTIHMAKGLEAENVILWGDFRMQPMNVLQNPEEQRVLYVGITRAKKDCLILS